MVLCAFGMEYLLNVFDLLLEHMDLQKLLAQFSPEMRGKRATSMSKVLFPQDKIQSLFGLKNREKGICCMIQDSNYFKPCLECGNLVVILNDL